MTQIEDVKANGYSCIFCGREYLTEESDMPCSEDCPQYDEVTQ